MKQTYGVGQPELKCPNCGFPMNRHSRLCLHCRQFVDWNQNRVLRPGEVSDAELDQMMAMVQQSRDAYKASGEEKRNRRAVKFFWIGLILLFTFILMPVGLVMIIYALIKLVGAKQAPQECLDQETVEEILTAYLVPPILCGAFQPLQEYRHSKSISARAVNEAHLMQEAYNKVSGSDYIRAVYRGIPVEMCDLELIHEKKDNMGITNSKTVFKGTFLICSLGITLPEPVTIWEREGHPPMGSGVGTGNLAFDQQFYVESRHPQTAHWLLTPQVIRDVLQLDLVGNGQTTLKFTENGNLYVAIASPQDMFEIPQAGEPAAILRQRFSWEFSRIVQLLSIVAAARDREWKTR